MRKSYLINIISIILSFLLFLYNNKALRMIAVVVIILSLITLFLELKNKKINIKKIYIILYTSIVIFFMFNLPFSDNIFLKFLNNSEQEIKITALVQKNSLSKGSEVWIDSILMDNEILDLEQFKDINEGWEFNGRVNYHNNTLSTYTIPISAINNLQLNLIKHPYSGICSVEFNNYKETLDLYSVNEEIFNIDLSNYINVNVSFDYFVFIFIIFTFIIVNIEILYSVISKNESYILKRFCWYKFSNILLFVWGIYFFAFYPALLTGDTIDQYGHVLENIHNYNDGHPFFHTLTLKIITSIFHSVASVTFFQILITSILVGICMEMLCRLNLKDKFAYIITLLLAIYPISGLMLMNIWKDILYSIALLLLTLVLIFIYMDKQWILKLSHQILLMIALICVCLYRHNGLIPYIFTCVFLSIYFWKEKRKIIIRLISITLVFILIFKGPVFSYFNISKVPSGVALSFFAHNIGTIYNNNGDISETDLKDMDTIMPLQLWKDNYQKYTHNNYCFSGYPYFAKLTENKELFMKLYLRVSLKNLDLVLKDIIQLSSLLWQIPEPVDGYTYIAEYNTDYTDKAITQSEYSDIIGKSITYMQTSLTKKCIIFLDNTISKYKFIYRPAFLHLILLMSMVIILIRKEYKKLICFIPLIGNICSLFISIIAQDYRYVFSSVIIVPILLGLCFSKTDV